MQYADVITQKIQKCPGVSHWWVVSCARDRGDWACASSNHWQEIEVPLKVKGAVRQVTITVDEYARLESAESLATRAIGTYVNGGASVPYCG